MMAPTTGDLAGGWQRHQSGDLATAERIYLEVLRHTPADPSAWCYLGMVYHDQNRLEEAVDAYRRAIQLQPAFPVALNNFGNTLGRLRRLDEALARFDEALRLQPDYSTAWRNKGAALFRNGRLDEATACYQRALQLAPDDAESHTHLGVLLLLSGNFKDGWCEYEWRWRTSQVAGPTYEQPLWDGSPLDGRTILLVARQGLGDTVHFIRYASVLKSRFDCRVVVACQQQLLPLLRSCPDVDLLLDREAPIPPHIDTFAPLSSVPAILGHTLETFPGKVPYLQADPTLVAQWKAELANYEGVKIGIVWQGSRAFKADAFRSIPLQAFMPLAKLHGLTLFSLQKGPGTEQLDPLAGRLDVVSWANRFDETVGPFMDTAAILKNLDLLIAADTVTAHIAGALGVPVWTAVSQPPADWRWFLEREETPWYPTMRLFRQSEAGQWGTIFDRIAAEILNRFPAIRRKQWQEYRLASGEMNCLTQARHGAMLYNRHDIYIGRSLERYGEYSEGEVELFRQIIRPGDIVVEAGANVGAHTIALSEMVGERGSVYAFEPQRVIFQSLCANVALNSRTNVHCRQAALGESVNWLFVPSLDYRSQNNFGGLSLGEYQSGERVPVVTIDSLDLPGCRMLKIDVEGMELGVLKGARSTIERCRPLLYVENDRAANSASLIEYLNGLGYNLYWHLPPLFRRDNYFCNPVNEFSNIVSVNIVAVHATAKSSISGLRPICGPEDDWRVR